MRPTLSSFDQADVGLVGVKLPGQFHLGEFALPDRSDVAISEYRVPRTLAPSVSAQTEVSGLNTDRSVTGVQYAQSVGRPDEYTVGDDVSVLGPAVNSDLAVSLILSPGGPIPAPVCRWVSRHEPSEDLGFGFEMSGTTRVSHTPIMTGAVR